MAREKPVLEHQEIEYEPVSEFELDTGVAYAKREYEKDIDRDLLRILVNTMMRRREPKSILPFLAGVVVSRAIDRRATSDILKTGTLAEATMLKTVCAVLVSAAVACIITAPWPKSSDAPKDQSRVEALYQTGFVLACDSIAQAKQVVKLAQEENVAEAIDETNAEMGAGACSFSRLSYNTVEEVEQVPDRRGIAVYRIFKFGWVTSYQLASDGQKANGWAPIAGGPSDEYVIMPMWGLVI